MRRGTALLFAGNNRIVITSQPRCDSSRAADRLGPAAAGGRWRRAFTLLEVLIVIVLLGVVTALVLPDFGQAGRSSELAESIGRFETLVAMCRAKAMNEARVYRILFLPDGSVLVTRQRDPLYAPEQYVRFREQWATAPVMLEHVWVEALLPLPEGPPPIDVDDELIEFDEFVEEPVPIDQLDEPFVLYFLPDGAGNSARWIVRCQDGRGLQLTLDGRLGRLYVEPAEYVDPEGLERPSELEEELEIDFEEDLEPLEERQR